MFRHLTPGQLAFDIGLAVACWILAFLTYTNGIAGNLLPLTGMAAALALRRFSPALALGIAWVTSLVQVLFAIGPDLSNFAILPVLYATARYGVPPVKWIGLGSTAAGAFVIAAYTSLVSFLGFQLGDGNQLIARLPQAIGAFIIVFFSAFAIFALSWTFGLLAKTWRGAREAGQARIVAERQRIDAQRSVIVEQERNRIARDMHDVVAHSLAVVIAQADGARYARAADADAADPDAADPDALDAALTTISATAREALGDVRILLGQLRHSQDEAPQPVLADLGRLLEQVRASGLAVTLQESGEPLVFAAGAQLAAYRIIQEALTNALRHGDSNQAATVALSWAAEGLSIEVSSALDAGAAKGSGAGRREARGKEARGNEKQGHETQGAGPDTVAPPTSGHGLAGMTERAVLTGGSLSAGPEGGRFLVRARIPTTVAEVPA